MWLWKGKCVNDLPYDHLTPSIHLWCPLVNQKAYLSYPALYTHVKNKHDGIFPIGSNAKRKIPRNMEENDDSFIIDSKKLMEEFEKFLKSLSGAYDNLVSEKNEKISDQDINLLFQSNFPNYETDIKPFVEALKWIRMKDCQSPTFMSNKDDLNIYQVLSLFLLKIYKVGSN